MRVGIDFRMLSAVVRRGMGRYTQQQVREVLGRGGDEELVLFCREDADVAALLPEIAASPRVSIATLPPFDRSADVLGATEELQRAIDRQGVDVFHLTTPCHLDDLVPWRIDAPVVATLYDLIPLRYPEHYLAAPGRRDLYERALRLVRRAGRVVAISHHAGQEAERLLGLPAERVRVAWPIAEPCFQPLDEAERERRLAPLRARLGVPEGFVLTVSHLHHTKNLRGLLDAWRLLPADLRRASPLVLACRLDPADEARAAGWARERGIEEDLRFTGFVEDAELVALYNAATLYVHPSRAEGFGLPVLEAMRCGAPVAVADAGSLPEVVGEAAARFDPERPEDLARVLEELLGDAAGRRALGDQARHRAAGFCAEDLGRDVDHVLAAVLSRLGEFRMRANFQLQVLSSLFYRNKGAYAVGKIINGFNEMPFALPILHTPRGQLTIDAALFGEDDLLLIFSFARAYFMVDMEVPSAYVTFLRSLMPRKPRSEIYNALGLQKQGKNIFYRDFLYHLRHSSDKFRIAPGIKGMVMLVFDLPSFPYVFKVIKDFYPPQKDTTREQIKGKYLLVKTHDRVGRMADTLEYSNVAFPRARFEEELIAELKHFCPSLVEEDGDTLVIRHLYIERRMIPLNIYLQEANPRQMEHAVIEYGNAIKDLVRANIFPGDMLWKNFGVTRHGKVVFYDYDEIEYLTDCNFRRVPAPRNEEEEMSGEVWYTVGPRDVFPETFAPFLLGNDGIREVFMQHHAELLDAAFWQAHQARIAAHVRRHRPIGG